MAELTEQQEQELIEKAKTGDPQANYDLSMWALDLAREDPEEERWNRLAAKCLLRAAEGGYEPAKTAMAQLLSESEGGTAAPAAEQPAAQVPETKPAEQAPETEPAEQDNPFSFSSSYDTKANSTSDDESSAAPADKSTAGRMPKNFGDLRAKIDNIVNTASTWDDARWKKVQNISIIVCIVIAALIILLIVTSGKSSDKKDETEETVATPVVEMQATTAPTATPAPVTAYPDDDTLAEIEALSLDVLPEEGDYVTEETTATVNASTLNMRRGPGTDYSQVTSLSSGATVNVYAYQNASDGVSWAFVEYNGSWGWCSSEYLG